MIQKEKPHAQGHLGYPGQITHHSLRVSSYAWVRFGSGIESQRGGFWPGFFWLNFNARWNIVIANLDLTPAHESN